MSKKEEKAKIRAGIEKAIEQNGPFSHNIILLRLSQADKEHGKDFVRELFDEFDLEGLGWTKP